MFNGYVYNGGKSFESYRTLEQMPIFCKAGAIIPMQKHIEYDNSIGRSKHLEIVIAAGESGEFSMFEDDGISRDYETGTGVITKYILNWSDNKAEFIINPAEGDMDLVHQKREYTLIFKGFKMNCEFFVEGKSLKFEYTEDTNTYRVYIGEVETDKGIEITVESASGLLHDNSDYLRRCSQMLLHSQTTSVTRNYLYSIAEKLEQNHRRKPEPIGENRLSKAFYELAIQK